MTSQDALAIRAYLSSYRLGQDAAEWLRPGRTGRAAIVMNALGIYGPTRLRHFQREIDDLAALGFASDELDLREYQSDPDRLNERLRSVDLVWVSGGNAFDLARAMTRAGFAAALDIAQGGDLVYAGYSAGACVAGPDLRGIELMDDPDAVGAGDDLSTPPETLGLVPFRLVSHWKSDHPESPRANDAVASLHEQGLAVRPLRDGEAVVALRDGTVL